MRNIIIDNIFNIMKKNKNIFFLTADMGINLVEKFEEKFPKRFLNVGIAEQNLIGIASGLSNCGYIPFVYTISNFLVHRCFEQIRYSCSMPNNPITILSNGVALGYAPAGPAHETNEDIAYMRSLLNVEIDCPASSTHVKELVKESYENQKLRYIRLERKYDSRFDEINTPNGLGYSMVKGGLFGNTMRKEDTKISIISYGYMLGRCLDVQDKFLKNNMEVSLYNMSKIKPNPIVKIKEVFKQYDKVITVEEQTLSGGFGSAVLEGMSDNNVQKPLLRIGLPERYIFENGDRDYHLDNNGLSVDSIYDKVLKFRNE